MTLTQPISIIALSTQVNASNRGIQLDQTIKQLVFTSWWIERKKKKYITITYEVKTEDFLIDIKDDDRMYKVSSLSGRYGPITLW